MSKTAKKPTPVVEKKDKGVLRGEAPTRRNEVAREMFMRSWGGGKHKNPQDYQRGHARSPKHKGQRSDRSWEGMTSPMARFEEGVSADPTVNMTPQQAAEWKKQNAIHRDQFTGGEAMRHPMARFEEGVPADPTKNMTPEQAAEWKRQNEAHRDEFAKAAASPADEKDWMRLAASELVAAWGPTLVAEGQSVPNGVSVKTAAHPLDKVRGHDLWPATVARKVPALYSQEKEKDPTAWVKLFSPYTNAVWYITEYDPSSKEAFGWADLGMGGGELGYISIRELEGLNKKGLPLVERDLSWKPVPLSRAKSSRMASEQAQTAKFPKGDKTASDPLVAAWGNLMITAGDSPEADFAALDEDADPKSKDQNLASTWEKVASGSGKANAAYLAQSPLKDKILRAVAKHYGSTVREMEAELTDPDAEAVYEYIGNDPALQMQVYRDFKAKGFRAASTKVAAAAGWTAVFDALDKKFSAYNTKTVADWNKVYNQMRKDGVKDAGAAAHFYAEYRAKRLSKQQATDLLAEEGVKPPSGYESEEA
jgi:hypothetical protein